MLPRTARLSSFLLLALVLVPARLAGAEDWPTYMHDSARSGVTADALSLPLVEQWVYRAPAEPRPAWPLPQPGWTELPKVAFDDAFYTVADRDHVYFGSSVDNQVRALDVATGRPRWTFHTAGPVRLAPTLAQGRVYFGSDDGKIRCLDRADGKLLWSFDAAPDPRRVLGNGRVISPWAIRTGLIVEDGRVYGGAGIFPYHKVFLLALDAASGQVVWKNDTFSVFGGFSPQGYPLSAAGGLIVPSGRAPPICVEGDSGKLRFAVTAATGAKGEVGGVYGVVVGDVLHVGTQSTLYGVSTKTGAAAGKWPAAEQLLATPTSWCILKGAPAPAYGRRSTSGKGDDITCIDREVYAQLPRKDVDSIAKARRWRFARPDLESMIVAGKHLLAGGRNEVFVLDLETGKELWAGKVDGPAVGLAVAHGRLLVSTTKGTIHCFAPGAAPAASAAPAAPSWPEQPPAAVIENTVKEVLRESGVRQGQALVLGHGAARMACELARRTELAITCVEFDPKEVPLARRRVDATGLYGSRISIDGGTPDALPYPDLAANLIVYLDAPGQPALSAKELLRVLRPCGGVLLAGSLTTPARDFTVPDEAAELWKTAGTLSGGRWARLTRGVLKGSGWWTHQYADAGGSGSSGDLRIKGRLDVLWFGEPGANEFPDRHQRGSAPLLMNGRVFCQGWNFLERKSTLFCFDAYNGTRYWTRELAGSLRLNLPAVSGNLACDADSVYVAAGSKCHRLDAVTGETRASYETPSGQDWAYLAVTDGLLFGSAAVPSKPGFSEAVFAFDLATGKRRWLLSGKEIRDTTLAYSNGRLLFVEKRPGAGLPAVPPAKEPSTDPPKVDRKGNPVKPEAYLRTVTALDGISGKAVWEKDVDLTDCGRWENGVWGMLHLLCKDDVLVLAGAYTIYGRPDEKPHRVMGLSAKDGAVLWSNVLGNRSRPVMMRGALLAEPLFYDLRTGAKIMKEQGAVGRLIAWSMGPRTGGCGSLSASDCMVFGRGGYTVWRDITGGPSGTFIGSRPGCLINIIPAGGVVVQAEASSGCACYQAVQCTVVFRPRDAE